MPDAEEYLFIGGELDGQRGDGEANGYEKRDFQIPLGIAPNVHFQHYRVAVHHSHDDNQIASGITGHRFSPYRTE